MPSGQTTQSTGDVAPALADDVPAGHAEQASEDVAPGSEFHVPGGQRSQTAAPAAAYVPGAHRTHVFTSFAPVAVLAVPAGQSRHVVEPSSPRYEPGGHCPQLCWPTYGLNVPGAQGTHASGDTWPSSSLAVPGGHALQTPPTELEYVPTRQGLHTPPSKNAPALQTHSGPASHVSMANREPAPFATKTTPPAPIAGDAKRGAPPSPSPG